MAIITIFNIPSMTQEKYDKVVRDLETKGAGKPDGRSYHVSSAKGTGSLIVDIWESEEKLARFGEVLIPTLTAAGVTPVEPEIHPVHNIITG